MNSVYKTINELIDRRYRVPTASNLSIAEACSLQTLDYKNKTVELWELLEVVRYNYATLQNENKVLKNNLKSLGAVVNQWSKDIKPEWER